MKTETLIKALQAYRDSLVTRGSNWGPAFMVNVLEDRTGGEPRQFVIDLPTALLLAIEWFDHIDEDAMLYRTLVAAMRARNAEDLHKRLIGVDIPERLRK